MRSLAAVPFVELAYRLDLTDDEWLAELAKLGHGAFNGCAAPTQAAIFSSHDQGFDFISRVFTERDDAFTRAVDRMEAPQPRWVRATKYNRTFAGTAADLAVGSGFPRKVAEHVLSAYMGRWGVRDVVQVQGAAFDDTAVGVTVPRAVVHRLEGRELDTWRKVSAHLGAGLRLRRALGEGAASAAFGRARAVFDAQGREQYLDGPAKGRTPRERLRRAAEAVVAARSSRGRENPEKALGAWKALFDGEISVLEIHDTDGKAFLVAVENSPPLRATRRLSRRERQVVELAARGESDSLIAYELGIDESTVRTHLRRAVFKTGVRTRLGLVRAAKIILGGEPPNR